MSLFINGTLFSKGNSGVQRYANNIIKNIPSNLPYKIITQNKKNKILLHLYEQFVMPIKLSNSDLLWSPTHLAPLLHKKSVITIHDILPIDKSEYFKRSFVEFYTFMLPRLLNNSIHIFTVSEFTKTRLINFYNINENKITITRNASIFNHYSFYNNTIFLDLYSKYLDKNKYFLVVGNIAHHKNSFKIIEIWKKLNINMNLVFIGKVPINFLTLFNKLISDNNTIFHFDNIDNDTLANFYTNAHATLLLSVYEGFGIPLIESNSLGCPVIHSDISVFNEISCDSNFPVNIDNDSDIASVIKHVSTLSFTNDFKCTLIKNSEKFKWENEARIFSDTINKLI
jgi:glycosyltransferase involved in cell wall biosynthesis